MSKEKKEEDQHQQVAISRRRIAGEAPIVVNEVTDRCLLSGFFGTLDSVRMKKIIEGILEVTTRTEHDMIIIDLSNVDVIDSAISGHLVKLNKTLQMVGLDVMFCGIKPIVAQSMVAAGGILDNIYVAKNLKRALKEAYRRQGLALTKIEK